MYAKRRNGRADARLTGHYAKIGQIEHAWESERVARGVWVTPIELHRGPRRHGLLLGSKRRLVQRAPGLKIILLVHSRHLRNVVISALEYTLEARDEGVRLGWRAKKYGEGFVVQMRDGSKWENFIKDVKHVEDARAVATLLRKVAKGGLK